MSAIQYPESGVGQDRQIITNHALNLQLIFCSISNSMAASKHMYMQQPVVLYNRINIARYWGGEVLLSAQNFHFYFNTYINITALNSLYWLTNYVTCVDMCRSSPSRVFLFRTLGRCRL